MQVTATTSLATATAPTQQQPQLKQACQQFEGYFLDMMFKEMRKTVPQDTLLGDQDNQQQIFTDMMDQNLADAMAKRGDLGISQMLYNQLGPTAADPTPTQEESQGNADSGTAR